MSKYHIDITLHCTKQTIPERIIDTCYGQMPMGFSKNKSLSIVPFLPECFMALQFIFDIKRFKDV